jgi:hypothetical protein
MKNLPTSDQSVPASGSTTPTQSAAPSQSFSPNNIHGDRDEQLASNLRAAITHRVETTLERASLDVVANGGVTPRWEPSTALPGPISASLRVPSAGPLPTGKPDWGPEQTASTTGTKLKTNRGKKIGLTMAAILGVITPVFALTRPALFASKPTQTQVVQVASADTDQFAVKLFAHDPDFKVQNFYSGKMFADPNRLGLHLSNGSVWIDVSPGPQEMEWFSAKISKPVTIGGASGELAEDADTDQTNVRWTVDEQPILGYGRLLGSAKAEVLAALGQIRFLNDKLVFERGTSKFSAVALEQDPNRYAVNLTGVKNRTEYVFYSVQKDQSYADDYRAGQKFAKRGNRTYYLIPTAGGFSQIWFRFGPATIDVSGQVTQDRLLDFADTLREATPEEWETVLARNMQNGLIPEEIPSKQVLIDGTLDEDDRASANFLLAVPPPQEQKQKDCVTVVFTVKEKDETSCIAKNSTEQFRLLETFTADGVTVVYGVDAPDERDNHVVRVTDAAGDVVAEDVTLDQREFTGRAFGLALPADSVAPFKVELFDYDREWYQSGEELPDTYVRPDSKPLATATVNP